MANYRKIYKDYFQIDFSNHYDVHHIDMDRSNNDINNLLLLPKKLHSLYHAKLYEYQMMTGSKRENKLVVEVNFQIEQSGHFEYANRTLEEILEIMQECEKWADYKEFLKGKMPNVHNISLGA